MILPFSPLVNRSVRPPSPNPVFSPIPHSFFQQSNPCNVSGIIFFFQLNHRFYLNTDVEDLLYFVFESLTFLFLSQSCKCNIKDKLLLVLQTSYLKNIINNYLNIIFQSRIKCQISLRCDIWERIYKTRISPRIYIESEQLFVSPSLLVEIKLLKYSW